MGTRRIAWLHARLVQLHRGVRCEQYSPIRG